MESIAIIGVGCRFPGASNHKLFWQLLKEGKDAITEVPNNRWSIDSLYNSEPGIPGKMSTRWGGFLEEIDKFDAGFFCVSPREAERIDPQQRLLLEVTWEALENSGIVPQQLAGSNTGVFIGISNSDYGRLISQYLANLDAYSGTGTAFSVAANRISYTLDLQGPSLAIDTACSSSLVAVHLACQSLQTGESSLCLAGGVNLILSPEVTITFSQARMMSADGRCKTFDASANGFVRGEGCGIVVLKRLSEAIQDRDNILAIIRGSAVNQDGLTNGITAPNGPSQQKVIRQALQNAKVEPEQISYVEAHGTGTALGDPVEVRSLKAILMQNRQLEQTCWLGSVKTNIGHLESAAGIASLIKVILALQHQEIPPHLHFEKLNPYISLEGTTFKIPTTCQTWETHNQQPRLAGISGFGFGGTNCHLIVQEYNAPIKQQEQLSKTVSSHFLLPLSAKTEESLKALASKYLDFLAANSEVSLSDICFTASTKRSHFPHRLAVIADSKRQIQEKLSDFVQGKTVVGLVTGKAKLRKKPKIAFVFTGQGSQYVGMGKQLYDTQPTFRRTLDQCNDILNSYLDINLLKVIYSDNPSDALINETAYTQPALFAIEYALAQLWLSWGIKPAVVMGHSVGEYVAATIAGVFSLEDGLKLIAARGRLMQALPNNGVMFAIKATESQAKEAIQGYESQVSLAAINGPQNIVISGQKDAVEAIVNRLEVKGVKTKQLVVSHAFHSPLMEPMLAEFKQIAGEISYHKPKIKLISNVTGKEATEEITAADYWCRHISQAVRFADGIQSLQEKSDKVFLEIGAKPTLLGLGRSCIPNGKTVWLSSITQNKSDWQQLLLSLAEFYSRGISINWKAVHQEYKCQFIFLPNYSFQKEKYWLKKSIIHKILSYQKQDFKKNINGLDLLENQQLIKELHDTGKTLSNELASIFQLLEVLNIQKNRFTSDCKNNSTNSSSIKVDGSPKNNNFSKEKLLKADTNERHQILKSYLEQLLTRVMAINPSHLDWQKSLSELGVDSLMFVELKHRFEKDLNLVLPSRKLLQSPCLIDLIEYLSQELIHPKLVSRIEDKLQEKNLPINAFNPWFIHHQPKPEANCRLFCFHHLGGNASLFRQWSVQLSSKIEVYPIQLPGRQNRIEEQPLTEFTSLIEILETILLPHIDRPFVFYGHSLGALIAFELVCLFEQKYNLTPESLFVSACCAPHAVIPTLKNKAFSLNKLLEFSEIPRKIRTESYFMNEITSLFQSDLQLIESYNCLVKKRISCPIHAFGGNDDPIFDEENLNEWDQYTNKKFQLEMFPGKHMFPLNNEKRLLETILKHISACISNSL